MRMTLHIGQFYVCWLTFMASVWIIFWGGLITQRLIAIVNNPER